MGLAGIGFVIVNRGQDWHSNLDYVAPVALILVGGIALISQRNK
jgi:hypothetical protein